MSRRSPDTWTIGNNKVNEFDFSMRGGASPTSTTQRSRGLRSAVNIPGFALFRGERTPIFSASKQDTNSLTTSPGPSAATALSFGADFNYLPISVSSPSTTVACTTSASQFDPTGFRVQCHHCSGLSSSVPPFPDFLLCKLTAPGFPGFHSGSSSPSDSFHNIPIGVFWKTRGGFVPT